MYLELPIAQLVPYGTTPTQIFDEIHVPFWIGWHSESGAALLIFWNLAESIAKIPKKLLLHRVTVDSRPLLRRSKQTWQEIAGEPQLRYRDWISLALTSARSLRLPGLHPSGETCWRTKLERLNGDMDTIKASGPEATCDTYYIESLPSICSRNRSRKKKKTSKKTWKLTRGFIMPLTYLDSCKKWNRAIWYVKLLQLIVSKRHGMNFLILNFNDCFEWREAYRRFFWVSVCVGWAIRCSSLSILPHNECHST